MDLRKLLSSADSLWLKDWRTHMLRPAEEARSLVQEACPKGAYISQEGACWSSSLLKGARAYGAHFVSQEIRAA
eukprot:770173-Pyramimonas_sp.AAC.1